MTDETGGSPPEERFPGLRERLDVWVHERLITRGEADAIAAFESRPAPGLGGQRGRGAPIAEALAYLGAALAISAVGVLLSRAWDDISVAGRIAFPGILWIVLLVAGWMLRGPRGPSSTRLSHALWLLSTMALAWFAGSLVSDGFEAYGRWPTLWIGAAVTPYAAGLYLARPVTIHQLPIVGGLTMLAVGIFYDSGNAGGLAIWVIGVAWIALGWLGRLTERGAALTIGTILVLIGPLLVSADSELAGLWLALLSASGLIGLSVALRHGPMLVLGAIGLFWSTFATIQEYMGGTVGAAVGLLVAGFLILALAFVMARLSPTRWRARTTSDGGAS